MRLHTDRLTADDLRACLVATGLRADGVYVERCDEKGSRSHRRAFHLTLRAYQKKGRRHPNPGTSGRWVQSDEWVPTWDEWGYFLAEVYRRDPYVKTDYYADAVAFHRATGDKFLQREGVPAPFALGCTTTTG